MTWSNTASLAGRSTEPLVKSCFAAHLDSVQAMFEMREDETPAQFAIRIAADLDDTVLAIQGPPGAGKTYTGARMICELVRNGARVGVTAVSHKVIGNLLEAVMKAADEWGIKVAAPKGNAE